MRVSGRKPSIQYPSREYRKLNCMAQYLTAWQHARIARARATAEWNRAVASNWWDEYGRERATQGSRNGIQARTLS
eukprot:2479501-Pleurochrysis_carterae.AAC.2